MRRQIADRLFMGALTLATAGVAIGEPQSVSYALVKEGGLVAFASMLFVACLACIALIDTVVNDVLPQRWVIHVAIAYRQAIWLLIAITYMGHAFVVMHTAEAYWVVLVYSIYGARCAAISFLDLAYEFAPYIGAEVRETGHGVLDA